MRYTYDHLCDDDDDDGAANAVSYIVQPTSNARHSHISKTKSNA